MSWGRRWTNEELQAHLAGKMTAPAPVLEKKITPEQSKSDSNERRKFRNHKPNGKHKFCESFMED